MYAFPLLLHGFGGPETLAIDVPRLRLFLDALVEANRILLRSFVVPPLYQSGVRYMSDGDRDDPWQDCLVTLQRRVGDCEDLATWRVAELREQGVPAACGLAYRDEGWIQRWHVFVRLPSGATEDPSVILGMA
jgi:hypothetical protein